MSDQRPQRNTNPTHPDPNSLDSAQIPLVPQNPGTVLVIGATVLDRIFYVESLPRPGETSIGHRMEIHPGGKGANQALAAQRMGAEVLFISAVGDDHPGEIALQPLLDAGVNLEGVVTVPGQPTAEAIISVDVNGENQITACPGAYHHLRPEHLDRKLHLFRRANWLLIQNELPTKTVEHAVALAREHDLKIIFNPDPFTPKSPRPPRGLHALVPNEMQACCILGVKDYKSVPITERCMNWSGIGARHVIVTLGPTGVEWMKHDGERRTFVPLEVEVVDSVGAGDAFCGALTAF
ncbi:MAG TPA: ribokinase, partial [Bacteroidetes bacterium]|nr:ribokinase [Bacteroidota bacterium]HEX04633.1 ribokinase [Bacteroidota bacterium]